MILLALFLALAPQSAPAPDPLASARAGRLECVTPDLARRTCVGLVRYEFRANGDVAAHQEAALSPGSGLVMRASAMVQEQGGMVCVNVDDFFDASFTIGGVAASASETDYLLDEIQKGLTGDTYCGRRSAPRADGTILSESVVDGAREARLDETILWVGPADGWRVAP